MEKGFSKGAIDKTLFRLEDEGDIFFVQIYVDDIIFESTNPKLCEKFWTLTQGKFEMSMMCELNYFLGIQVKNMEDGIFINQVYNGSHQEVQSRKKKKKL